MIEYCSEKVLPREADDVMEIKGLFGWSVVDSQEIYREDTRVTGADIKVNRFDGNKGEVNFNTVTNVTNYVTIRFARDTAMPDYEKLSQLEKDYERYGATTAKKKPIVPTAILAVGLLIIIISVINAIVSSVSAEVWEIVLIAVFLCVMIPLTAVSWVSYSRSLKRFNYACRRCSEILNKAEEIINGAE